MRGFIMHCGQFGQRHLPITVENKWTVSEILARLDPSSPEYEFFQSAEFANAFPSGEFNVWGVQEQAEPFYRILEVGDVVIFAKTLKIGVTNLGVVLLKMPFASDVCSRIFWPEFEAGKLYPNLFFFHSEAGKMPWSELIKMLRYKENFNPRGSFVKIADDAFDYSNLKSIRENFDFEILPSRIQASDVEPEENITENNSNLFISESSESYVTNRGQGFNSNPKERKAIEQQAMNLAKQFLQSEGWIVDDRSLTQPYDFYCVNAKDYMFVEVKGTTGLGSQIILTKNEVAHFQNHHPNTALIVVHQISLNYPQEGEVNAEGGELRIIRPWSPSAENLVPLSYTYIV